MPRGPLVVKNPDVLIALLDLTRRHVPRSDICLRLRISRATYYRMLKRADAIREAGPPAGRAAP